MAKKQIKETSQDEAIIKKVSPKIGDILKELSVDYFKRFPNVEVFYAVESKQFFFKENDALRNKAGGDVHIIKRDK